VFTRAGVAAGACNCRAGAGWVERWVGAAAERTWPYILELGAVSEITRTSAVGGGAPTMVTSAAVAPW